MRALPCLLLLVASLPAVAQEPGVIAGRVTDAVTGQPVAGAFVAAIGLRDGRPVSMSLGGNEANVLDALIRLFGRLPIVGVADATGRFELTAPAGMYQVVLLGGQRDTPGKVDDVLVVAGELTDDVDLKLDRSRNVSVELSLLDSRDQPLRNHQVFAQYSYQGRRPEHRYSGGGSRDDESDADGHFTVTLRGDSEASLLVRAAGLEPALVQLALGAEPVRMAVKLNPAGQGMVALGALSGLVTSPNGDPLAGVRVVARGEAPGWRGTFTEGARTDADGRYRISGLPPGEYRLTVGEDSPSSEPVDPVLLELAPVMAWRLTAVAGETTEVAPLALIPAAILTVRLETAEGLRLPKAKVRLKAVGETFHDSETLTTDHAGHATRYQLRPGDYELEASLFGRDEPIVTTATLAAGPNTVVIRVP